MKLHLPKALVALVVAAAIQAQADTEWGWNGAPTKDGSTEILGLQTIATAQDTQESNISVTGTTECIWVKKGRGNVTGNLGDNVQAIYAVGGQLFVNTSTQVNAKVFMGGSEYDEPGAYHNLLDGVAVRLSNGSRLANAALVDNANIAVYAGSDGTINNLDLGEYVLTVKGTTGGNDDKAILTVGSVSGTGSINVDSGVLNLGSGVTTNLSGIGQNAEVTGSGKVVLAAGTGNMSVNTQMNSFTGNITIGDGQTLTAQTVGSETSYLSKGSISVEGGGTLSLVGKDALGWHNNKGVSKIILQGDSDDKKASMVITGTQTLVSVLELRGDTVINAAGTGASLSNYESHNINVTGTRNVNEVEFKVRENLEINVAGENDTFKQAANISSYLGGTNWEGTLTKTGAGKMILGEGITLKLNDAQGDLASNHAFVVSAGTLEVENGVTMDGGAITVTGGSVDVTGKMTLANGAVISDKAPTASDAVVKIQGKTTRAAGDTTLKGVTVTNNSITGGSINNGNVELGGNASVSNVNFTDSTITVDTASVTMSDVVFGSGTTVTGAAQLSGSNTVVLTETAVNPDNIVFDRANPEAGVTLTYLGLGDTAFAAGSTLNLVLTHDFVVALQKEVLPSCTDVLTINFGTTDLSDVIFGTATASYLSVAGMEHADNGGVKLTFTKNDAIPEPATAALSLLALAGLAARRRCK